MSKHGPLIFLAVAFAACLPVLLWIAWPFVTSFVIAAMIAIVVFPLKEWISRRTRRPGLAAAVTTLVTVTLLGIVLVGAGWTITHELASAYDTLNRRSLEEGGWPALATASADRVVEAVATRLPIDKASIRTELIDRMKDASAFLLGNIDVAVGGVTTAVITLLLVTVLLYFLLRSGRHWIAQVSALTPLEPRTASSIVQALHDSVVANVNGMVAVVVGQGLLLMAGFWFVGMRSALLWGAVGGLASIIPLIGAPIVWLPVAIAYLLMGSYWKALILALWCSLVVGSVDNVIRPLVVGARERQHPVLIALAAIGGTYAFGPLGILLGPLALSLAAALWKELRPLLPNTASLPPANPGRVAQ